MIGFAKTAVFACVFGLACAGVAGAQDAAEDNPIASKVRKTGVAIGNAFSCTEAETRDAFREEAIQLFDLIVQDEGSDMAFLYAASVGYGSAQPKDGLDCPVLLEQWAGIREDFRFQIAGCPMRRGQIGCVVALLMTAGSAQAFTPSNELSPAPSAPASDGAAIAALIGVAPLAMPDISVADDRLILARGGGGARGGARAAAPRQPGGHSAGQERAAARQGSVERDVDIDVDNDPDRIIEDDAVRGAVVGVTVGAAIASSDEPTHTCPDEKADGVCDDNVAN